MTTNKYWLYLEQLRESGVINMYAATPYLKKAFKISYNDAETILADWMHNYNKEDYK